MNISLRLNSLLGSGFPTISLVLATMGLAVFPGLSPVQAAVSFEQTEVDQNQFIAIAAPRGSRDFQLLILQQVSATRPCWNVLPGTPALVEPLLLNFNFKGICNRSLDSNGYSIRVAGQDLALTHSLRVVPRNGELVLVGVHNKDRKAPEIEIGRTYGVSTGGTSTAGFSKIVLNPNWRFALRAVQGKVLGHVYLTNDSWVPSDVATSSPTPVLAPPTPIPVPPAVGPRPPAAVSPLPAANPPALFPTPTTLPSVPVPATPVVIPTRPPAAAVAPTPVAPVIIPIPQPQTAPTIVVPARPMPTAVTTPVRPPTPAIFIPVPAPQAPATPALPFPRPSAVTLPVPPPISPAPIPVNRPTLFPAPSSQPAPAAPGYVVPTLPGSQAPANRPPTVQPPAGEGGFVVPAIEVYR